MYPDFVIAGTPKCGSTTLYSLLKKHPQISMSNYKEPYFYLRDWGKDWNYYQKKHFPKCLRTQLVGEATVDYLAYPEVGERIFSVRPDTKFIIMMRHPTERAFSHYWQKVRLGRETKAWSYMVKNELEDKIFQHSFYYKNLQAGYLNQFPENQFHYIIFEEFISNMNNELQKVFKFLNLPSIPMTNRIAENSGTAVNSKRLKVFEVKIKNMKRLYNLTPQVLLPLGKFLLATLDRINKTSLHKVSGELEDYRPYLNDLYKDDVYKLKQFLGRELPWVI